MLNIGGVQIDPSSPGIQAEMTICGIGGTIPQDRWACKAEIQLTQPCQWWDKGLS